MIVLDTHALVWWVSDPERLSDVARDAIDREIAGDGVHVSSISAWEIAMLVEKGRLELTLDPATWLRRCERLPFVHFHPVDNGVALRSVALPAPFHPDPADRIIVATALRLCAAVITKDRKIQGYPHVPTIW